MKDFKSFSHNNKITNDNPEITDKLQKLLNKYKDMDNNQLMQNLIAEAARLKREGKLDHATITNLKNTLSPFLNCEQVEALDEIIKVIDE